MKRINTLLKNLNIKTNKNHLYYEALTHKSYSNEQRIKKNYQRLEFLGDAILDFVVSEYLIKNFKNHTEGEMSILRSNSVKGTQLAKFALNLGLDKYVLVGNNTKDFKNNSKIYADIFEAMIAAIYLDKGIEYVKIFLDKNVFEFLKKSKGKEIKNPKTILQEYLQLESRGTIKYETKLNGKLFISNVFHEKTKFGTGYGPTKKEAEVKAAINALDLMGKKK